MLFNSMILEKPYHDLNIDDNILYNEEKYNNNIFFFIMKKNIIIIIFFIINTSVARLSSVNVVKFWLSP